MKFVPETGGYCDTSFCNSPTASDSFCGRRKRSRLFCVMLVIPRARNFFGCFALARHDFDVIIAENFRVFQPNIFDEFAGFLAADHRLKNFFGRFRPLPGAVEKSGDFLDRVFRNLQTDEPHAFVGRRANDFERRVFDVFDLPPRPESARRSKEKRLF